MVPPRLHVDKRNIIPRGLFRIGVGQARAIIPVGSGHAGTAGAPVEPRTADGCSTDLSSPPSNASGGEAEPAVEPHRRRITMSSCTSATHRGIYASFSPISVFRLTVSPDDDCAKDAHGAIIDRGLPALQRRAPTGRTACTHRSVARRSRCRIHSEPRSSLGRRLRAAPRVPRATQAYPRTTISPQEPHPDARRQLHAFSRIFPWKGQQ